MKAVRDPAEIAGYLELHIEQGYRLDRSDKDIGIVTSIVGRSTYKIVFRGEASHSGTTAMGERRDALHGAAAFVVEAHKLARKQYVEGVFNCGNLEVSPGAFNIIPDKASITLECRHADKTILADMEAALVRLARSVARKQGLDVETRRIVHMPAAVMSESAIRSAELACQGLRVNYRRMISYAGHDAQIMSNFTRTGMIFIPSVDGISHSPKEYTEWQGRRARGKCTLTYDSSFCRRARIILRRGIPQFAFLKKNGARRLLVVLRRVGIMGCE